MSVTDKASEKVSMPGMIRADGAVRASFTSVAGRTAFVNLYESGGYRLKFPKAEHIEAVLINTGGGMAGNDRLEVDLALHHDAHVIVTTQSAEKIYRADSAPTEVTVKLTLDSRAHLAWLPQETLLFTGSRLHRTFDVNLSQDASLDIAEGVIFGRGAAGERITSGDFRDRWRIKREGQLIYADNIAIHGAMTDSLDRAAIGKGARAIATFLCISPHAESRLDAARSALSLSDCECGASAWNGMLLVRFVAPDPAQLRRSFVSFIENFRGASMPRVWQC